MLRNLIFLSTLVASTKSEFSGNVYKLPNVNEPNYRKCEIIKTENCENMPYNKTQFPNNRDSSSQAEAIKELDNYYPLLKVTCSPYLRQFICSYYLPPCLEQDGEQTPKDVADVWPCRSLCVAAKDGCVSILKQFGYDWPPRLDCDQFPNHQPCIAENEEWKEQKSGVKPVGVPSKKPMIHPCPANCFNENQNLAFVTGTEAKGVIDVYQCGYQCHEMYFSSSQETLVRVFVFIFAVLCAISTLFTLLTALLDLNRFRYPLRPIIFIAGCYFVVGVVHVTGFILGDHVACTPSGYPGNTSNPNHVTMRGTRKESCTILFMLFYFFSQAAAVWWLVLCVAWFLAAGLKWSHEAIGNYNGYFHVIGWTPPAVQTIVALALSLVEGDPLTGICVTGLTSRGALQGLLLAPLTIYLGAGLLFLLSGFCSLFRIRTIMKAEGTRTDKLEKLMLRIGIFNIMYCVPTSIVVACLFYELQEGDTWRNSWYESTQPSAEMRTAAMKPNIVLTITKYLMQLLVGVATGVWILSLKSAEMWRQWLCCEPSSKPITVYHPAPQQPYPPPPQYYIPQNNYMM